MMLCCAVLEGNQTLISTLSNKPREEKKESEEPSVALCGPISLALPVLENSGR